MTYHLHTVTQVAQLLDYLDGLREDGLRAEVSLYLPEGKFVALPSTLVNFWNIPEGTEVLLRDPDNKEVLLHAYKWRTCCGFAVETFRYFEYASWIPREEKM